MKHKYYLITPYLSNTEKLVYIVKSAIKAGFGLIQLRCNLDPLVYKQLAQQLSEYAIAKNAILILKGNINLLNKIWCQGLHLTAEQLLATDKIIKISNKQLVMASCHNQQEITQAEQLNLDSITLSPIARTLSHPEAMPIKSSIARELTQNANIPVFWLGGQQLSSLATALAAGACGIAGISTFKFIHVADENARFQD